MLNAKPLQLYFQIGGAFSIFHRYQKVGRFLLYQKFGLIDAPQSKITQPDTRQWQQFTLLLDELNVWKWQPKYENYGVDDGRQWEFKIAYKSKKLSCKGDNNYPQADGSPNNDVFLTETFCKLLEGLEQLRSKQET